MDVQTIKVDRAEALKMWQKYRAHRHNLNVMDSEIEKIYEFVAKGKVIINALASIVAAGLNANREPRLAIARADDKMCYLSTSYEGRATMSGDNGWRARISASREFKFAAGSFPNITPDRKQAVVPHIPPDVRPRRGIQNYHVLWEAVWEKAPPVDPMLLRRVGSTGDIWLVVAAWDLTDVERAVMQSRMMS